MTAVLRALRLRVAVPTLGLVRSWATRVLVVGFLPVFVLVATELPANAEVYTTPSVGFSVTLEDTSIGPAGTGDIICDGLVEVVYVLPTSTVPGTASPAFDDVLCAGGADWSFRSCQPGEQGCPFKAWLKGSFCGGALEGDLDESEHDGVTRVSGRFSGSYYAGDQRCDPASVCIRLEGSGSWRMACTPVNLDPPDVQSVPTACPWGDPGSLTVGQRIMGAPGNPTSNNSYFPFTWVVTPERVPPGGSDNTWKWYAGYYPSGSGGSISRTGPATQVTYTLGAGTVTITGNITVGNQVNDLAGIGIFHVVSGKPAGYYADNQVWSGSQGVLGATEPTSCRFWRGAKWANTTSDTIDDPLGPLGGGSGVPTNNDPLPEQPEGCGEEGQDPCATEEECDFQLSNPSTWLEAGMCVVASGFGELVGAIEALASSIASLVATMADLAGDIAAAILGGLGSLFIPGDGFFDDAFAEFQSDLNGPDVQAWRAAFEQMFSGNQGAGGVPVAYSSGGATMAQGSGCQGPGFSWDKFEPMGQGGMIYPLQACSGISATAAGVVKTVLMAVLGIGSLVKCIGIISSALGFTKDTPAVKGSEA